jgi:AcrR family transcriptional regulator
MPKPTFLKLKVEKKEKFILAAFEEFAQHHYETASISRLVDKLGIAKGSIYQYFEDKKDLYLFLIEYANQQKQKAIAEVIRKNYANFFEMYEQIYVSGTQFDLENPLISRFLQNVSQERYAEELGDLHLITQRQSIDFFKNLLKNEQLKGLLRSDIEADLMALMIVQVGNGILDFIKLKNLQETDLNIFFRKLTTLFREGFAIKS